MQHASKRHGNNGEKLEDTWRIESGALQHSSTNKRSRPEILGPRRKGKRDEVKQELKRRGKESRAFEKKRGTVSMTRIESSLNQIDYETTPVKTR